MVLMLILLEEIGYSCRIDFLTRNGILVCWQQVGEEADAMNYAKDIGTETETQLHFPRIHCVKTVAAVTLVAERAVRLMTNGFQIEILRHGQSGKEIDADSQGTLLSGQGYHFISTGMPT